MSSHLQFAGLIDLIMIVVTPTKPHHCLHSSVCHRYYGAETNDGEAWPGQDSPRTEEDDR